MSPCFPKLGARLAKQLEGVEQTDGLYFPCCVTLHDGSVLDCVYLAEAVHWFELWGIWPQDDRGKRSLDLSSIATLESSPSRLPVKIADQLYAAGESGMGYTIFTIEFVDGTRMAYQSGNAIDFVRYPLGQGPETVAKVFPHVGRDDSPVSVPEYYWCLYKAR